MSKTRFFLILRAFTIAIFIGQAVSADESSPDKDAPRSVPYPESAAAAKLSVEQIGDRLPYQVLRRKDFPPAYTSDIQLEAMLAWGEVSGQPGYLQFVR